MMVVSQGRAPAYSVLTVIRELGGMMPGVDVGNAVPINTLTFALSLSLTPLLTQRPLGTEDSLGSNGLKGSSSWTSS